MPQASDAYNPAKIDLPAEIKDLFMAMERRIRDLEMQVAELSRQPWQADIAAVKNAMPTWSTLAGKPSTFPPSTHDNTAHSVNYLSSVSWSDVGSKPATFPPDAHTHDYATGITGKPTTFTPSSHNHAWADLTSGVPTSFTPASHGNEKHTSTFITGVAWSDITSKPTTFTPASHGNEAHSSTFITGVAWADITSKPSTFTPASHGNEAHSSAFSKTTHDHHYYDKHAPGETNETYRNTQGAFEV